MTTFNRGVDLQAAIADLRGLDREVLSVLRQCVGRGNAMPRKELIACLQRNPAFSDVDERKVRLAIHELRQSGQALICSTGGKGGGYWIAANHAEVDEFIDNEIEPRAYGLLETKKAMLAAAGRLFGPKPAEKQERLF